MIIALLMTQTAQRRKNKFKANASQETSCTICTFSGKAEKLLIFNKRRFSLT